MHGSILIPEPKGAVSVFDLFKMEVERLTKQELPSEAIYARRNSGKVHEIKWTDGTWYPSKEYLDSLEKEGYIIALTY